MFFEWIIIFGIMILWTGSLITAPLILYKLEKWADKIIIRKQKSK